MMVENNTVGGQTNSEIQMNLMNVAIKYRTDGSPQSACRLPT